jgi:signal transduction histidine kinase
MGAISFLNAAAQGGAIVKILAPLEAPGPHGPFRKIEGRIDVRKQYPEIQFCTVPRMVGPSPGLMLFTDRKSLLIIEEKEDSSPDFLRASGIGLYSKGKSLALAASMFFQTLWNQGTRLESEENTRKRSQLLQDILTHDIRNLSQVSLLNAEALENELEENETLHSIANGLINSILSTTELLETTNRLGKVLLDKESNLRPINLVQAIESSITLVRRAHPDKSIDFHLSNNVKQNSENSELPLEKENLSIGEPVLLVSADELLGEAFVNLFWNSAKYTDGDSVNIEVEIDEQNPEATKNRRDKKSQKETGFYIISIKDRGRGISDDMKGKLFTRYLDAASGTGLGLSIVHAIIVDRYQGKIEFKNRVDRDYMKGTTAEISLREWSK